MAKTKSSPSRKVFLVINYIVLTVISLTCILPFINLLAVSFSDKTAVAANAVTFWPVGFNTAAYDFILSNDPVSCARSGSPCSGLFSVCWSISH